MTVSYAFVSKGNKALSIMELISYYGTSGKPDNDGPVFSLTVVLVPLFFFSVMKEDFLTPKI